MVFRVTLWSPQIRAAGTRSRYRCPPATDQLETHLEASEKRSIVGRVPPGSALGSRSDQFDRRGVAWLGQGASPRLRFGAESFFCGPDIDNGVAIRGRAPTWPASSTPICDLGISLGTTTGANETRHGPTPSSERERRGFARIVRGNFQEVSEGPPHTFMLGRPPSPSQEEDWPKRPLLVRLSAEPG